MHRKSAEQKIVIAADKVASDKENVDALSWSRVSQIGDALRQEEITEDERLEFARELISIAHTNTSLAEKLGIDDHPLHTMASGVEVFRGSLAEAGEEQHYLAPAWEGEGEKLGDSDFFEAPEDATDPLEKLVEAVKSDDADATSPSEDKPEESAAEQAEQSDHPTESETAAEENSEAKPAKKKRGWFRRKKEQPADEQTEAEIESEPETDEKAAEPEAVEKADAEAEQETAEEAVVPETVAVEESPEVEVAEEAAEAPVEEVAIAANEAEEPAATTDEPEVAEDVTEEPVDEKPAKKKRGWFRRKKEQPADEQVEAEAETASEADEKAAAEAEPQAAEEAAVEEPAAEPEAAEEAVEEAVDQAAPVEEPNVAEGPVSDSASIESVATFKNVYNSRDGGLVFFQDDEGHITAVNASKLA